MRKAILLALGLVLVVGTAKAEDFIRYIPPALSVTSGGSFATDKPLQVQSAGLLCGPSANVLDLQNGGTAGVVVPQTLNVYRFCDGTACATGYQRLTIGNLGSNRMGVSADNAGTGGVISLYLGGNNVAFLGGPIPYADMGLIIGSAANRWYGAYLVNYIQGGDAQTLVDAAVAVSVWRVTVGAGAFAGGEILWVATSTDGTDHRTLTGRTRYAFTNKSGTEDCNDVAAVGTDLLSSTNANTLVCTWTGVNVANGSCDLQATCTDNTAGDQTIVMNSRIDQPITATIAPQ